RGVKFHLWPTLVLLTLGCATVKSSSVEKGYETADQKKVKRLLVVTAPLPEENPKLGQMWSLMARRYVNLKRDFLVKGDRSQPLSPGNALDAKALCGEGLEGVLWLKPNLRREGDKVNAAVSAALVRCSDGGEIWSAQAQGTWSSEDSNLKETIGTYVNQFGP